MPLAMTQLTAPDHPPAIATGALLDLLYGAALIAQGFTPDQAAAHVRRGQTQRAARAAETSAEDIVSTT
jgi:hypothetical protein